jgi:hypothetical protein
MQFGTLSIIDALAVSTEPNSWKDRALHDIDEPLF